MAASAPRQLALVLAGGGARAAYQVGVLRVLGRHFPELDIPILTGVSAGAINAAFLASHSGSFRAAITDLADLWAQIVPEAVFRTEGWILGKSLRRWALGLVSGGSRIGSTHQGFMDTTPLDELLRRRLPNLDGTLVGVQEKIELGRLKALGITTTDYGTGQAVTWVQGRHVQPWIRPHRRSREATLTIRHVLASAALPLLFPAVHLSGGWHGDGGIRLTAPLAPAMHLGATHVLALSNRYRRTQTEADASVIHGYPPAAQIIGTITNAIFLDMLDFDATNMERFNRLIPYVPDDERGELRTVRTAVLRPSQDLGRLAAAFEARLPASIKFFTRGFGTQETDSPDSLSLLMFQPDYIEHLMALGEADAEARLSELTDFVCGTD